VSILSRIWAALTSLPGRLLISALLLAVVARSIDWSVLSDRLSGAAWGWFALATVLVCIALLVGAVRWHALLHHADLPARPLETLWAYGIGVFSNNFLPTGFGGDLVRAWLVARSGKPLARAFTSVLVDRAAGLIGLFLLGWLGILFLAADVPSDLVTPFAIATAAGAAAAAIAVAILRRRGLGRFLPSALRPWASEVAATLRAYGRDRGVQAEALVLSIGYQALMVTSTWMLARSLQLDISLAVLAVVMPLILIATLLPISVAGFGVREGAYVVLLGEVGVSASDATLLSLFTVASLAVASLPGGIGIMVGRGGAGIAALGSMQAEGQMSGDRAPTG
jgi:glycosyltransferase 2 family protein